MRRLLVLTLLVLSGLTISVGPALAHDVLDSSNPAAGSTLTALPQQIVLTFEEPPDASGSSITVVDTAGKHMEVGAAAVHGATVSVDLAQQMPNGTYTVSWRVISDDGHPVSGTFPFTMAVPAQVAPTAAPAAVPAPAPAAAASSGLPVWAIVAGIAVVAVLGGLVVARRATRARA